MISFGALSPVFQWNSCFRQGGSEFETRIPPSAERAELLRHVPNPHSMDVPKGTLEESPVKLQNDLV